MKWMTSLAMLLVLGASFAFAQVDAPAAVAAEAPVELANTDATAVVKGEEPIRITDTEAGNIISTINGYMQGPTHRGRLELMDRRKGELVLVSLDRLVLDDPERVAFPQEDQVAICGECTQVAAELGKKGKRNEHESGDKYEVWFVVQRGGIASTRVLDTYIKSVNGVPMYEWTQNENGSWSATLVPEAK